MPGIADFWLKIDHKEKENQSKMVFYLCYLIGSSLISPELGVKISCEIVDLTFQ
jgi:hypothetical protein